MRLSAYNVMLNGSVFEDHCSFPVMKGKVELKGWVRALVCRQLIMNGDEFVPMHITVLVELHIPQHGAAITILVP